MQITEVPTHRFKFESHGKSCWNLASRRRIMSNASYLNQTICISAGWSFAASSKLVAKVANT